MVNAYGGQKLANLFTQLQYWGFGDFILPFLLLFALVFAILQKAHIFGKHKLDSNGKPTTEWESNRKINGILAFAVSLGTVVPHVLGMYPVTADPIVIIGKFLPSSAILFVSIVVVLLILGIVAPKQSPSMVKITAGIVGVIILIISFTAAGFPKVTNWGPFADPQLQALIISLIVMALVIWFVARGEDDKTEKYRKGMRKMFGA